MTPTATPDAGVNTSDINSLIDSASSTAMSQMEAEGSHSADTGSEQPPELEALEPAEQTEESAPDETTEQQVEAQPEPEPEEESDPNDDLSKPDRVSKDGKLYYYKPSRVAQFQAAHKAWSAIQNEIPGATIESLRDNYLSAAKGDEIMADFESGQPEQVSRALEFFVGNNPQTAAVAVRSGLDLLARTNPQGLQHIENRVMELHANRMYDAAQNGRGFGGLTPEQTLKLAQNIEFAMSGKFRTQEQLASRDVMADRERAIEARERQFAEQQTRQQQERIAAWSKETQSAIDAAKKDSISAAIPQSVMDAFKGKPQAKWIVSELAEKVDEAIANNTGWKTQFEALRRRAEVARTEESRSQLVAMMKQFVQPIIAKNAKAVIEAATGTVVGKSAAAHQKLAAAAVKREPAGPGAPRQGAQLPSTVKDPKSAADLFKQLGW